MIFPIYFHVRYDTELNKNGKPEIVCKDVSDHDFVEVVRCKDCRFFHNGGRICAIISATIKIKKPEETLA